jgi:hypothetical protein
MKCCNLCIQMALVPCGYNAVQYWICLKFFSIIQWIKIAQGRMHSNPCTFVPEPAVPQNAVYQSLSTATVPTTPSLHAVRSCCIDKYTVAVIAVLSAVAVLVDTGVLYDRDTRYKNYMTIVYPSLQDTIPHAVNHSLMLETCWTDLGDQ